MPKMRQSKSFKQCVKAETCQQIHIVLYDVKRRAQLSNHLNMIVPQAVLKICIHLEMGSWHLSPKATKVKVTVGSRVLPTIVNMGTTINFTDNATRVGILAFLMPNLRFLAFFNGLLA